MVQSMRSARNVSILEVMLDEQLIFKGHISKSVWSCRFALHTISKIRPLLTEHDAQLLVQGLVISRLYFCNALLAGLTSCEIKPLQMIQNAAAWLLHWDQESPRHITSEPKWHIFVHLFLWRIWSINKHKAHRQKKKGAWPKNLQIYSWTKTNKK